MKEKQVYKEEKQVYIVECGKICKITIEVYHFENGTEHVCLKGKISHSLKGKTWAYTYEECRIKLITKIIEEISTAEKEYKKKVDDLYDLYEKVKTYKEN